MFYIIQQEMKSKR